MRIIAGKYRSRQIQTVAGDDVRPTSDKLRGTLFNLFRIVGSLGHGRAPYKDNPDLDISSGAAVRLPHGVMIAVGTLGFLAAALRWPPPAS